MAEPQDGGVTQEATSSAQVAWANAVIRRTIVQHADKRALLALLRVNLQAHEEAVAELYRHVRALSVLQSALAKMRNHSRRVRYLEAVCHVENVDLPYDDTILPLLSTFPNMRSLKTISGHFCRWKRDPNTGTIKASVTMVEHFDHESCREAIKRFMPDDWSTVFHISSVKFRSQEDWKKWSVQPTPAQLPRELILNRLDNATLEEIVRYAKTCEGEPSGCTVVYIPFPPPDPASRVLYDLVRQLRTLGNYFATIELYCYLRADQITDMAPELANFRHIELMIDIWDVRDPDHKRTVELALQEEYATSSRTARVVCCINTQYSSSTSQNLTEMLASLDIDSVWLRSWAYALLYAFGPLPTYSICFDYRSGWESEYNTMREFAAAVAQTEEALSQRLNDIIRSIVIRRRSLRAPGWRQVKTATQTAMISERDARNAAEAATP